MSSRRRNRRIASYATVSTTQKTGKKTSKVGGLFVASCLRLTSGTKEKNLIMAGKPKKENLLRISLSHAPAWECIL